MRYTVLLVLALYGCGGPSAPTVIPTPAPAVFPSMIGGWSGVASDTWVSTDGSVVGSRTCNETWLVTSQSVETFTGAFQSTPGSLDDCAMAGTLRGTVSPIGSMTIDHGNSGLAKQCTVVGFLPSLLGVLSVNGNITAGAVTTLRCQYRGGLIDYRLTHSVALSRR